MNTTISGFNYLTGQKSEFEIDVNFSTELIGHGQWKLIAQVEFSDNARNFSTLVFAGFMDDLAEFKESDPSYEEINEFCATKWPDFEQDEAIFEFCAELSAN